MPNCSRPLSPGSDPASLIFQTPPTAKPLTMTHRAIILTISDRSSRGEREDLSGPEAASLLRNAGFDIVRTDIVPDDRQEIAQALRSAVAADVALVVTTGGTGFAERDVTPEATIEVIERRADGLSEAMRAASLATTKFAMLSRGVSGIAARTLIINLPGSPKGVGECLAVILPVLPHALSVLRRNQVPDEEHDPLRG